MVRTDCREQKLDAFYAPKSLTTQVEPSHSSVTGHNSADGERKRAAPAGSDQTPATKKRRHHKPVELTSVRNLQRKVLGKEHKGMLTVAMNFTVKLYPTLCSK